MGWCYNDGGTLNISYNYATGTVSASGGTNNIAGGLIGYNSNNYVTSTMSNCYATGTVTASGGAYAYAGGLVGENDNFDTLLTITNSYATGAATASGGATSNYAGGLLGYNYTDGGTLTASKTYATGTVSASGGTTYAGGLIGWNNGTVTNSFYNSETSGQSDNTGKGVPHTTAWMKTYSNFSAIWTFSDTNGWVMDGGSNADAGSSYPYMYFQVFTWTGATDSTWANASNWTRPDGSGGTIVLGYPDSFDDKAYFNTAVSISTPASELTLGALKVSAGTLNLGAALTLSQGSALSGGFTLSGGTLNTSGTSYAINLAGDWKNSGGTFTPNSCTVTLNGSGAQTITSGGSGAGKDFNNVILDNNTINLTATGGNPFTIGGTLVIASGHTPTITTNGNNFIVTGTTNGTTSGVESLNVNAGAGSITFSSAVGGGTSLGSFTATSSSISLQAVTATGAITITTDAIDLQGAVTSSGGSDITLQPVTSNTAINLHSGAAAFSLTLTELGYLATSGTVIIGASGGSGTITIGSTAAINLSGESFSITLRGGAVTFSNQLTLPNDKIMTFNTAAITSRPTAATDLTIGGTTGTVIFNTSGSVGATGNVFMPDIDRIGASTIIGNLYLNLAGDLAITGPLSTASANGEIRIIMFANLTTNAGATINSGSGRISVYSNQLALNDTLTTTGTVFFNAWTSVGLNDASGTFNLTAAELGYLNCSGTVEIYGSTAFTIGSLGAIDLSSKNFNLQLDTLPVTFNNSITLGNDKTLTFYQTGAITSASSGYDVIIGGTTGTVVFTSTTGAVGTSGNPFSAGIDRIGASTVGGNLYLVNDTSLTLTGALTTAASNGIISLNAGAGTFTSNGSCTIASGNGAITITADGIALGATVTGGSSITLQPSTVSKTIGIGDGASGDFNLDSTEIGRLTNGFSSITIGAASGSGNTDVRAITFNDPVTIQIPSGGTLTLNGAITGSGNASVTLTGAVTLAAGITTAGNAISINGAATLNAATVSIDATNAGGTPAGNNISFSSTIGNSSARNLTLNAGTGGVISVTGAVGSGTALGTLTITNCSTGSFSNTIAASGYHQDAGSVTFSDSVDIGTGGVTIDGGALIAPGNTKYFYVTGNWTNSGTFTASSGTVTFTATSSGKTINTGGAGVGKDFYNITFNGSGGGWNLENIMSVSNDFTMTLGTFDMRNAADTTSYKLSIGHNYSQTNGTFNARDVDDLTNDVIITNDYSQSAGTFTTNDAEISIGNGAANTGSFTLSGTGVFTAGASTIIVGKDWDSSGGTFTINTSTVDLQGSGNVTTKVVAAGDFYDLKVAANGKTTTLQSDVTITHVFTVGATGVLDGNSKGVTLRGLGTPFVHNGATITNLGGFWYRPSASGTITVAGGNYGTITGDRLRFYPTVANTTFNLAGTLTVAGSFWLVAHTGQNGNIFNTQNYGLNITELEIGASDAIGAFTCNLGSSIVDIGTGGVDTYIDGGSHNLNLESATITCAGLWELIHGTGTTTQDPGSSTVTFDGSSAQTITSNGSNFKNVVLDNNTINLAATAGNPLNITGTLVILDGHTPTITTNNNSMTVTGTTDGIAGGSDESLTIAGGSGTVTLTGAVGGGAPLKTLSATAASIGLGGNIMSSDVAGSSVAFTGPVTLNNNITIDTNNATNDGSISFSSTVDGAAANSQDLTVDADSGTVSFDGAVGGTKSLRNFTITSGAATLQSGATLTVEGTFTISAGSLAQGANNILVGGFTITGGSITRSTGTFNGGVVTADGTLLTFSSNPTFTGNVTASYSGIQLNGATFNGTTNQFTETTTVSATVSTGGNTFGVGSTTTFTNTGANGWYLADASGNTYNGNIQFESTGTGAIRITNGTAISILASGCTISIGTTNGFTAGALYLGYLTQTGSQAQTLTLTSNSQIYFTTGTTFGGNLTVSAPYIRLNGSTFNGTTNSFTNTNTGVTSTGANTFGAGSSNTFTLGSTGTWRFAGTSADTYYGNITFQNNSTGTIEVAYAGTNDFAGNVVLDKNLGTITVGANGGTMRFTAASPNTQTFDSDGVTVPLLTHSGTGTLDISGYTLTVTTFTQSDGTFKLKGNEVTFTTTNLNGGTIEYSDNTLAANRAIMNWTYTNVTLKINGSGSFAYELPANITCAGINIAAGTLAVGTNNLAVSGDSAVTGGTLTIGASSDTGWTTTNLTIGAGGTVTSSGSSKVTISGNYDQSSTTSTFTASSSTITINGNGTFTADATLSNTQYNSATLVLNGVNTLTYNNIGTTGWINGFNSLICGQNGNITTMASGIAIGSVLTIGSGTLTGSSVGLYVRGASPLSFDVNSRISILSLYFFGTNQTIPTLTNGYDCNIVVDYGGFTITQTGNVTINASKHLRTSASASKVVTWKTDGYNLTVGGYIQFGQGSDTGLKTLDATRYGDGIPANGGRTSTVTVGGNWLVYGTGTAPSQFIADNSTVILTGTGAGGTITSGATNSPFYNLTQNGSGGTYTLQDALTVNGTLTLTAGTLALAAKNVSTLNFTITGGLVTRTTGTFNGGNLTADGTILTFPASTTFTGNVTATYDQIKLSGSTFNGITNQFTYASTTVSATSGGGNTFGAGSTTTFTNTGTCIWYLGYNSNNIFNGNIQFENTSVGQIRLTAGTCISTLADGKTISIGPNGFISGGLDLKNLIQTGNQAQTLNFPGVTAYIYFNTGTTFGGNITVSAPKIYLNGSTFNGIANSFTNTDGTSTASTGGNTFIAGSTNIFTLNGSQTWRFADTSADNYYGNVTFDVTDGKTGTIQVAYSGVNDFKGNVIFDQGTLGTITVGGNGGTMQFSATTPTAQTFDSDGVTIPILTHSGTGTLDISGYNFIATTFNQNAGTFKLKGNETATITNNNLNGGTIEYLDSALTENSPIKNWNYTNVILKISGSGSYAYELPANLTCAGINIESGTLDVTTNNRSISCSGDWTNSGTFIARSGTVTMTGASKSIAGTASTTFDTLTIDGTYTNNNAAGVTVLAALNGSGALAQGAGAVLNISGTSGITTLTAAASGNTVNYNGAAQTVRAATYYNLTVSGSGIKIVNHDTTIINGTGTIGGTAQVLLAVNAAGVNKLYDGTDAATVNLSVYKNIFTAYTVSPSGSYTAAFNDSNVGDGKVVSVSGISLTGSGAGEFTCNVTAFTTANITSSEPPVPPTPGGGGGITIALDISMIPGSNIMFMDPFAPELERIYWNVIDMRRNAFFRIVDSGAILKGDTLRDKIF